MIRRSLSSLVGLVLLATGVGIFPASGLRAEDGAPDAAVRVTVETLSPEKVVIAEEVSGRVMAYRRVEIRPQVGGIILERTVNEGQLVAAGDLLFRIDPAPLRADLATAEAALTRAEAVHALAQRAAERSDALLARNAVSSERNDTARNDLAQAAAGLAEAQAMVERRKLDLEFATLRAPIAGYVSAGLADIGGLAAPGSERALAVIQDVQKVYVDLRVPAAKIDNIMFASEEGLGPVIVEADSAGGATLQGQLRHADVIVDPGTGNIAIRVELDNPDLVLLPGMFVRAQLPREMLSDALLVPEDAVLRNDSGGAQLVVVSADATAMRRDVWLGDRVGNRVIVKSGLAAGDTVAIRGQDRVPAGRETQVITQPAEPPSVTPQAPAAQN